MKKKRKYRKGAKFYARYPYLKPEVAKAHAAKGKVAPPKFVKNQVMWHVDGPLENSYAVVSSRLCDGSWEYKLRPGITAPIQKIRHCMEKELVGRYDQLRNYREDQRVQKAPDLLACELSLGAKAKAVVLNRDLQIGVLTDQLHAVQKELADLKAKTQGNLGVLVPELQKERNEYMQHYNNALRVMTDQSAKIKRLQAIVTAFIDGRI